MFAIEEQLHVRWEGMEWQPVYHANGFTFQAMPVITQEDPQHVQLFQWGLIPHWVKSKADADKLKAQTLNARTETAFEKPSFRGSMMYKRCLIPADGFFEWMDISGKKYPHYIQLSSKSLFCFGGIYAHWTDKQTGEIISTFSILTTEANSLMEKIHNLKKRMPVMIDVHEKDKWLNGELTRADVEHFFIPYASENMSAYTISKLISSHSQSSDIPELLEKIEYPALNKIED
jgi:putative SOS response-associated peptidase YedK